MAQLERIQKIISQSGIASRRKAEELIRQGKVTVNGKVATIGQKVSFSDEIFVGKKAVKKDEPVYYIINKPRKTLCTLSDPRGRDLVTDYIREPGYVFPVGRLDWDTTGTLFITNDGDLSNKLTHPSFEIKRVYRARLRDPLTKDQLKFLNSQDVKLDGRQSKQEVDQVDTKSYVVVLSVGTYHHVKRLFELVDNEVRSLTRIEYGGISHVGLSAGQYRKLKPKEIKWLKQLVEEK